jgi:hypothetical protein
VTRSASFCTLFLTMQIRLSRSSGRLTRNASEQLITGGVGTNLITGGTMKRVLALARCVVPFSIEVRAFGMKDSAAQKWAMLRSWYAAGCLDASNPATRVLLDLGGTIKCDNQLPATQVCSSSEILRKGPEPANASVSKATTGKKAAETAEADASGPDGPVSTSATSRGAASKVKAAKTTSHGRSRDARASEAVASVPDGPVAGLSYEQVQMAAQREFEEERAVAEAAAAQRRVRQAERALKAQQAMMRGDDGSEDTPDDEEMPHIGSSAAIAAATAKRASLKKAKTRST